MTDKPQLKHRHIIRLGRLLDMLYRPSELAEEIHLAVDTIYRSYLPAGCPHLRDLEGNIWIHGPAFVQWARETICKRQNTRAALPTDQAWCVKCKQAVPFINPAIKAVNHYIELMQSPCPRCATTVNRARARKLPSPLQGEGQGMGVQP